MNASRRWRWCGLSSRRPLWMRAIAPNAFCTSYLVCASAAASWSSAGLDAGATGAAGAAGATGAAATGAGATCAATGAGIGAATCTAVPDNRASCCDINCICWAIRARAKSSWPFSASAGIANAAALTGAAATAGAGCAANCAAGCATGCAAACTGAASAGSVASSIAVSRSRLENSPISWRKVMLTAKVFCSCSATWVSIRLSRPSSMKLASPSASDRSKPTTSSKTSRRRRVSSALRSTTVPVGAVGPTSCEVGDATRCGMGISVSVVTFNAGCGTTLAMANGASTQWRCRSKG